MPLASPRGVWLMNKYPKDLGRAVRDCANGKEASFSAPGLKEFEEGYELKGLNKKYLNLDSFYETKGIDYVNGVIDRFKDEGSWKIFNKKYREALKFKENYNSKK